MTPPLALRETPGSPGRWLLLAVGALTGGLFGLAFVVDAFGRREGAREADVAVVLGARVLPGGKPSRALRARVERAVALYHQGLVPRLLFSGGVGRYPPAEARVMEALARGLGVPAGACLREEESRSTEENAARCAGMLGVLGARRVVVVSDAFHLLRARQCFRRAGVEVATSPAPLAGRHWSRWDRCYWTLREAAALLRHPRVLLARAPPRGAA